MRFRAGGFQQRGILFRLREKGQMGSKQLG